MRVVGVLLAAGRGERYGGDKLLAPLADGTPMGVAACRTLVAALPVTIAVVRPGDAALAAQLRDAGAEAIECADAALGMGRSLAAAVSRTRDADAWIVALADMPWVRSTTIAALVAALDAGASIAAPVHRRRRGNPVGFAARWGGALCALRGDRGARDVVSAAGADLTTIDVDDDGVIRDVDLPGDLGVQGDGDR
ncbi:MAG TPA: nucleotidyltransferase family protein [Polyangia bacterium]|nr:nucleotidyltransferase family protein [Polyangia bacterium]